MGCPTSYDKCNISKHDVSSIFSLIIDNIIVNHIKACTEVEAGNKSGNKYYHQKIVISGLNFLLKGIVS